MNLKTDHSTAEPHYRWVIVFASAIMLAIAMGVMVNGFSVYFIALKNEFGWQRGAVSLINFSGLIGLAFGGIIMGRIADRATTRIVCLSGAIILGICLIASSWAQALWQFYVLFFVAGLMGAGAIFTPLIANVGNWFRYGPGLALGIASAGQALGQGGVPYATAIMIGAFGWRDTLTILGSIALITLVPLAMLIKQPPGTVNGDSNGVTPQNDKAVFPLSPNITIAWLSVAVVFCCICMSVPLMHLVPLIQDRGIDLDDAGSVIFVMLLVAILGRIFFGKLADMLGAIQAYMIASLWQTVLVFGFIQMTTLNSFYIFAIIYGFGYAGVMTTILVCVRVLIPISSRATALGIVTLFGWVGHAIGGSQGGFFYDLTGNYTLTYANAAIAGIINLIIVGSSFITINRRRTKLEYI